jgi:L,D-transpeptidase catalytic domain
MLARKPEPRQHMVQLQSGIGMKGGPDNPIGARAMYLWSGNKDTLYRIHGTNEPGTIGTNVSSGCIRLTNEDIVDLYNRTPNRRESHRVRDRQTGWATGPSLFDLRSSRLRQIPTLLRNRRPLRVTLIRNRGGWLG